MGPALVNAARDDVLLYRLLLTRLMDTNAADLTDLRRAAALRDRAGVQRSVHRLKGSGA
ncbi:Hpt domain-containing protein [Cupriavidus sp. RAF12]|uniref:Hpt domain-containing protein n=1 Tax=Cupriavidus sp. RAF12 TaxID=3233050 RepID=UPI003F8DF59E